MTEVSVEGAWAPALLGVVPSLILIFYRLKEIFVCKIKTGSYFMTNSNWLTPDRQNLNRTYFKYILVMSTPSIASMWIIVYGFDCALRANINSGIVSALFSLASFYISILFYFVFNEKVTYF